MRGLLLAGVMMQAVLLGACASLDPAAELDAGAPDGGAPADGGGADAAVPVAVGLEASSDSLEGVRLSWDAGAAAVLGFVIERDGVTLSLAGSNEREHLDTTASAGWLEAPGGVVASEKQKDGIVVAWDAAIADSGSEHRYVVRAELEPGVFVASNEARGWRAAPAAELYEVQRADGGALVFTSALSVFDEDAGGWSLDASVDVRVEEDDFRTTVILSADASIALERVPASYRVRAMQCDGGAASAWSPVVTGRRTDELYVAWQWQRSAGPASAAFADLPRVMGPRWFDPYPVLDETRFYRLALRVERLGDVVSPARSATLRRPLKLALGNNGDGRPSLCVLRTDGALHCRNRTGATPAEVTWDAGTDVEELEGSPELVCARFSDGGAQCWGQQPVQPPAGPLVQLSVQDSELRVCGLDPSRTALCTSGSPSTPDGGWLWLDAYGSLAGVTTQGIRARDRAFERIPNPGSQQAPLVVPGPFGFIYVQKFGLHDAPVGILTDGGLWPENALPSAPGGYRYVFEHTYATCGVRADGYALCRGNSSSFVERVTTNVAYRDFVGLGYQACGITTADHVDCWGDRNTSSAGTLLPPRMPIRDLALMECSGQASLEFLDTAGRFFEYAGSSLRGATVSPDDRFAAIPRPQGCDVTLVRVDGGVVQWSEAKLPAGTYVKVDGWCGLESGGRVQCDGWSPTGTFIDVVGGRPCGLRTDGGIECQDGTTPLASTGPFTALSQSSSGILCALRIDGDAQCDPPGHFPSLQQPVTALAVNAAHLCGLLADGGVRCVDASWAAPLPPAPPGPYRKLSVGETVACGIRTDDTAVCWASSPEGVPVP